VFDALGADQDVGHFADIGGLAADHEDLEAIIVIEVDVKSGEDGVKVIVLDSRKLLIQHADVMVVHKGERADDEAVRGFGHLLDEFVPNEIPEGFGTVGVAALGDQFVEFVKEIGIDRHANPAEAAHAYTW
jgi:hypothetical protein